MILTLARPCEVNRANWDQIDLKARLWAIPAENMKEDRWHVVHLADQTTELLMELKEVSGDFEAPSIIAAAVHAGHSWARALDDKDSVTVPAYLPMALS